MKDKIFFPLIGAIAISAILVSIIPNEIEKTEVNGAQNHNIILLNSSELNQIKPQNGFAITYAPGPTRSQTGPRIISETKIDSGHKGVSLAFSNSLITKLSSGRFGIAMEYMPLHKVEPQNIAIGIYGDNQIKWSSQNVKSGHKPLFFDFSNLGFTPRGMIINPATEGELHGLEIKHISFLEPAN